MTQATGPDGAFGLQFKPLPAGWTPLAGTLLAKCLDEDGGVTWAFRTTEDMNDEELLGALSVRTELLRRGIVDSFGDSDDEE